MRLDKFIILGSLILSSCRLIGSSDSNITSASESNINLEVSQDIESEELYFFKNGFKYAITDGVYYMNDFGKACYDGDFVKVREFIEGGIDIETDAMQDINFAYSALACAVMGAQVDIVEYLIMKGANVNREFTESLTTSLTFAVRAEDKQKRMKIARALIDAKADPNGAEKSSFGYTDYPLIAAINSGDVDFVQLLIESGGSAKFKDEPENFVDQAIDILSERKPQEAEQIRSIISHAPYDEKMEYCQD